MWDYETLWRVAHLSRSATLEVRQRAMKTLSVRYYIVKSSLKSLKSLGIETLSHVSFYLLIFDGSGAHSLNQPNNKRSTTYGNRRGLGSQVDAIPHRSLINPFRPDQFYVRITANRRRWIHVFPVDEMVCAFSCVLTSVDDCSLISII